MIKPEPWSILGLLLHRSRVEDDGCVSLGVCLKSSCICWGRGRVAGTTSLPPCCLAITASLHAGAQSPLALAGLLDTSKDVW